MKKTALFMGIIFLISLSLYPLFGILLEKHIQDLLAELFSPKYIQYQIEPAQKGFFSSKTSVKLEAAEELQWKIDRGLDFLGIYPYPLSAAVLFHQEHGPFPLGGGLDGVSVRPVAGRVNVRFDREKNRGTALEKLLLLGITPQLTVTIYLNKSGNLQGKLPAYSLQSTTEDTPFPFICSWTDCLFSADYNAELDNIVLQGENRSFGIKLFNEITLQTSGSRMEARMQHLQRHPQFYLKGGLDSLTFGSGSVKGQTAISGITFSGEGELAEKDSSGRIRLVMQQAQWEQFSLADCLVSAKISGISSDTLIEEIIALGRLPQIDMHHPTEVLQAFKQPLRQIIRPGVKISIDDLYFDIAGEGFVNHLSAKMEIKIVKPLPGKLIPDISLLQCMDADGEISLPQDSVESVIRQVIEKGMLAKMGNFGSMLADNSAVSSFVDSRMMALEEKGILIKDGRNYRFHITWQNGKLQINGKPFSMELLLPSLL